MSSKITKTEKVFKFIAGFVVLLLVSSFVNGCSDRREGFKDDNENKDVVKHNENSNSENDYKDKKIDVSQNEFRSVRLKEFCKTFSEDEVQKKSRKN